MKPLSIDTRPGEAVRLFVPAGEARTVSIGLSTTSRSGATLKLFADADVRVLRPGDRVAGETVQH